MLDHLLTPSERIKKIKQRHINFLTAKGFILEDIKNKSNAELRQLVEASHKPAYQQFKVLAMASRYETTIVTASSKDEAYDIIAANKDDYIWTPVSEVDWWVESIIEK